MLAITGVGMVSSLGLDVVSSCAAARANLGRMIETDDLFVLDDEGEETAPVVVHRVPLISAGFFGFARLVQLGRAGLVDLLRSTGPMRDCRVGFVLLVGAETYRDAWLRCARAEPEVAGHVDLDAYKAAVDGVKSHVARDLLQTLAEQAGLTPDPRARETQLATSVGLVAALQRADDWIARSVCDRCVIGGVDSLLDPTTLDALNELRLLKSPDRPAGLTPGEGSCFLVVESTRAAAARRALVYATIESPATAMGEAHPRVEPNATRGDGLASAVTETLSHLLDAGRSTGLVVANLNGDPYRASSWSDAVVRVLAPMQLGALPIWLPALFFGDTGAATGLMSVALLVRGWARRYAPSSNALVCLIDDAGARGSVYLRAAS